MRTTAVGYYGMSNFGDDLFCEVVTDGHSNLWPGSRFRLFLPSSTRTARSLRRIYQGSTYAGSAIRIATASTAMAWASHIVLAGGSVLQAIQGRHGIEAFLAKRGWRTFSGLGVSLGPFWDARDEIAVAEFVRRFSRLVVRDRESLEYAWRWGMEDRAKLGGDLAALYPIEHVPRRSERGRFRVGLLPCNFPGLDVDGYIEGVRAFLRRLENAVGEQPRVTIFALNFHRRHGDTGIGRKIAASLADTNDLEFHGYTGNLMSTLVEIANQDFNISTRLHGGIMSYLQNVPFAQIAYHRKCRDFTSDIGATSKSILPPNPKLNAWEELAEFVVRFERPTTTPHAYRERARLAYFEDGAR